MSMTFSEARHLLARTGFGGDPSELRRFAALDRLQAVDNLLGEARLQAGTAPPSEILSGLPPLQGMNTTNAEQKKAFQMERKKEAFELKAWWYRELLTTASPLT